MSFPPFPAVVMLPFVALNGYQFNDTSFTVIAAALALASFYSLLRFLARSGELDRSRRDQLLFTGLLGAGSLFFYCAIRGEVWFTAEIARGALHLPLPAQLGRRAAAGARRAVLRDGHALPDAARLRRGVLPRRVPLPRAGAAPRAAPRAPRPLGAGAPQARAVRARCRAARESPRRSTTSPASGASPSSATASSSTTG